MKFYIFGNQALQWTFWYIKTIYCNYSKNDIFYVQNYSTLKGALIFNLNFIDVLFWMAEISIQLEVYVVYLFRIPTSSVVVVCRSFVLKHFTKKTTPTVFTWILSWYVWPLAQCASELCWIRNLTSGGSTRVT